MPMQPQDPMMAARRSQLGALLASAFGAPQGRFGSGLALGVGAGQEAHGRTLADFIQLQLQQEQQEQQRREAEQMMAYRQLQMEQMQQPAPDPVAEQLRLHEGMRAGGYGQYEPEVPKPGADQLLNEELARQRALKAEGLGSYYQRPQQPKAPKKPAVDPLWDLSIKEAAKTVRERDGDPSEIGAVAASIYDRLKESDPMRRAFSGVVDLSASDEARAAGVAGRAPTAPAPPPRPKPQQLLPGGGGDGSARLAQLLADHREINPAVVEQAKRQGMTPTEIADLIEQQLMEAGFTP